MKLVAVLLLVLFLAGCATKPIEVSTVAVDKAPLVLPAVDRFQARDVEWFIVTPQNYQEVIAKLKASGKNVALFAVTDKGYENLGLNLGDIQTIVRQQQAIIGAYQEYYIPKEEEKVPEKVTEENWFQKLF